MEINITIKIDGEELYTSNITIPDDKYSDIEKLKKHYNISRYAQYFDECCSGWTKDPRSNLMFLKYQERYANERLKAKGYLFLNQVYEMLGIPITEEGQLVGWVYDVDNPIGDNYVSFGLDSDVNRDFINGFGNIAILDFNVDGYILNYISKK